MVNALCQAQVFLSRLPRTSGSPDPGDDFLLAMCLAAEADYLVTGDKALLRLDQLAGTRIISARRFAALLAR